MIARYTRNTYLFSIIAGFQAAWFVEAVWFFYWRIFATYTFIGVLFSIISILILILELPTGIFADKFGRKTATVLGSFILAIGGWGIALGTSIWWLLVGLIFQTVGRAFISGALEALVYDSLKADGKVDQYDQIATRKSQITTGVFAAAVIIGGFLYPVYFRLPHLLMGAVMTCSERT